MRRIPVISLIIILVLVSGFNKPNSKELDSSDSVSRCEEISRQIDIENLKDSERQEFQKSVEQAEPTNQREIRSCQQDKECIFVPESCLGMFGMRKQTTINAKFGEYYYRNKLNNCEKFSIINYFTSLFYQFNPKALERAYEKIYYFQENHRPECVNNKCLVTKIPVQQDVYDCYFKAAVSTDNVTLCKRTNPETSCIYEVAKHSKNPDLCKEILAEFSSCYQDVLCSGNNQQCKLKVREQIRKGFPEIAKSKGEYGICIIYDFDGKVNSILEQEEVKKISQIMVIGDIEFVSNCFIINTDTPFFTIDFQNLIRDVKSSDYLRFVYHDGSYYSYNESLIFDSQKRNLLVFKESFLQNYFNLELGHNDCTFEKSIYKDITEKAKSNLNMCQDINQYLIDNKILNFKDKCKEILIHNLKIKCFDSYAWNNDKYDLCVSLNCKLKTAPDFSVCKDLYIDNYSEQNDCKARIAFEFAKKKMDENYCNDVTILDHDTCVTDIAINKSNVDLCNALPLDQRRFRCYDEVSLQAKNSLIHTQLVDCEELQDKPINLKLYCYRSYALIFGDPAYCERLGQGTKAAECYEDLAKKRRLPS